MRGRARQHVVDHDRGDGGDEPERGREQRLGDPRRHHGEIGGVRLGDADEAVHDAPDRAEQADEGRGRADGGEDAGAARNLAARRHLDALELPGDALLQAVAAQIGGDADLGRGRIDQLRHRARALAEHLVGLGERGALGEDAQAAAHGDAGAAQFERFGDPDRPGYQRGKGEPDHHRLHDDVGVQEHAPGREVLRQLRGAHRVFGKGRRRRIRSRRLGGRRLGGGRLRRWGCGGRHRRRRSLHVRGWGGWSGDRRCGLRRRRGVALGERRMSAGNHEHGDREHGEGARTPPIAK